MPSVYVEFASSEGLIFEYEPGVVPRYTLYPATDDVLAVQERLTLYCGRMPVPPKDSLFWLEALLANVRFAESAPLLVGAKTTSNATVWPALMVIGSDMPEIENCELLLLAEETVTLPAVAVIVDACVVLVPTFTLPKLNVLGAILSFPIAMPVPVKNRLRPAPSTKILPLAGPAACGAKETLRATVCPVASVTGRLGPLTENPVPVNCSAVMVLLCGLGLLSTIEWVALLPTFICPKDKLEGLAVSASVLAPQPSVPICRLGFVALLVMVIIPLACPVLLGLKVTLRAMLWPAFTFTGKLIPEMLNSELLTLTAETVALVAPILVRIIA